MPRNPYRNETILFPNQIDNFPSLVDQFASGDPEASILFAEDYNKVRNLLLKMSKVWVDSSSTASGDGTLKGLSYAYTIHIPLRNVIRSTDKRIMDGTADFPGNMLPFEVVITSSSDNYQRWWTGRDLLIQDNIGFINSIVGGMNFFGIYPMVQATIANNNAADLRRWGFSYLHTIALSTTVEVGDDTMVIRGIVWDRAITDPGNENWSNGTIRWTQLAEALSLRISIVGVKG
jgi:hypothetical protein